MSREKPTEPIGLNGGNEHIWRFISFMADEAREMREMAERRYMFLIALNLSTIGAVLGAKFL